MYTIHSSSVLTTDSRFILKNSAAAFLFALALVCAGQMSSITVTLAGQSVSEGFIEWKITVCIIKLSKKFISIFLTTNLLSLSSDDSSPDVSV